MYLADNFSHIAGEKLLAKKVRIIYALPKQDVNILHANLHTTPIRTIISTIYNYSGGTYLEYWQKQFTAKMAASTSTISLDSRPRWIPLKITHTN